MAAPTVRDSSSTQEPGSGAGFLVVLGPENTETRQLPRPVSCRSAGTRMPTCASWTRWPRGRTRTAHRRSDASNWRIWEAPTARACATSDLTHQRIAVARGDAIAIGTTILVVQRKEPAFTPRRLWPHAYFETGLIETCAQAETARGSFAVVRLHVAAGDQASRVRSCWSGSCGLATCWQTRTGRIRDPAGRHRPRSAEALSPR